MANIYSISLGCPKNRVDAERLLASIPGMTPVESVGDAECVIINTCSFIEPAVRESVSVIAETIEDIAGKKDGQKHLLVVSGCLVGRYGEKTLAPELPEVDLWLDNRDLDAWAEKLREMMAAHGLDTALPAAGTRFCPPGHPTPG